MKEGFSVLFGNLEVFNAAEFDCLPDGGHTFLRVPQKVENALSEQGKRMNRGATGVELRFVMNGDKAVLTLKNSNPGTIANVLVYYGDFIADWPETDKRVTDSYTKITIVKSPNLPVMRRIAREAGHRFSPDVVRIILNTSVAILGTEGDIRPPKPEECPGGVYLAYGSSITHGSIAACRCDEFVFRLGEELGLDARNLGFAGAAALEPAMADYLAAQPFACATLEMGINILGITPEDFEQRVRYFVKTVAGSHPDAPVFAIDVFYCADDISGGGKAALFRMIVEKVTSELALPNVVYINGLSILPDGKFLTSGLVHPGPRAIRAMTDNLVSVMSPYLKQK